MNRTRLTTLAVGLTATLLLAVGLTAPAQAAFTGQVSGVISLRDTPLAGAEVRLLSTPDDTLDEYSVLKKVTTDSTGRYSFSGYQKKGRNADWLWVVDPKGRAVAGEKEFNGLAKKAVTANMSLQPAGNLAGTVTRKDGATPTSLTASLTDASDSLGIPGLEPETFVTQVPVDENGRFRFSGLPAGTYTVAFHNTSKIYRPQCYGGEPTSDDVGWNCAPDTPTVKVAATSTATQAAVTTADPQVMQHRGSFLRGTVTDWKGDPVDGVMVWPVPEDSPGTDASDLGDFQVFNPNRLGAFNASPLAPGRWQIYVHPRSDWAPQWYGNTKRPATQVFDLAAGQGVKELSVKLKSRPSLSATVKPGTRQATVSVKVLRKIGKVNAAGKVTITNNGTKKTLQLSGGAASLTWKNLAPGPQSFRVDYSGTVSTAPAARTVTATVK